VEDLLDSLTRGNVPQVKTVVATVALALAVYQVVLIAVAYGRVRPRFLGGDAAGGAHRASGDTIVVLLLALGAACLVEYGFDDDAVLHAAAGAGLLAVLAFKVAVVRGALGLASRLPELGTAVFLLLCLTWATSAAGMLGGD
jgi:Family of unknown function (DUF6529)